jgi:SAM-dependent methyltransferase
MSNEKIQGKVQNYFRQKLEIFGSTPRGLDYNSPEAMEIRFDQLMKIVEYPKKQFSIIDYGCGYGAIIDYMVKKKYQFEYYGIDYVKEMIDAGIRNHPDCPNYHWTTNEEELPIADYVIAGSIFNIKVDASDKDWTLIVIETLGKMNSHCTKGFSFNMLTKYSDPEKMRPDLYYADPCFLFNYCKTHFSRNVALLHDYKLYDFTLLIRKEE